MENKLVKQLVKQVITKQDMKMLEKFELLEAEVKVRKKEITEQLTVLFRENGIKTFDSPNLRITYVEPTTKRSLDTMSLKTEMPDVYESYLKESPVSDFVKIKIKYE